MPKTFVSNPFRIIGIGASAGGLEPLTALLANVSTTSGMALIVIQHQTANGQSLLTEILARAAKVRVVEAEHDMEVTPNVVYVSPNKFNLEVRRTLRLMPRNQSNRKQMIDLLFRSIAESQGSRSGAVILSGALSDGVEGIKLIKQAGGVTFAQSPDTTKFKSMPENAIKTGCVDYVRTPEEIGRQLSDLEG